VPALGSGGDAGAPGALLLALAQPERESRAALPTRLGKLSSLRVLQQALAARAGRTVRADTVARAQQNVGADKVAFSAEKLEKNAKKSVHFSPYLFHCAGPQRRAATHITLVRPFI